MVVALSPASKSRYGWKIAKSTSILKTTNQPTSRVSKSHVPFTCKFTMVMHFVPILHRRCRSKTNFYFFSYDKTSLNFCASFRFFPCSIHGEIPKNPLSELCEKRNPIQARIQRGGGSGHPPWDLSEVWSCVEARWVWEGVQQLFLPYYYHFFLASFARQYYTNILLYYYMYTYR